MRRAKKEFLDSRDRVGGGSLDDLYYDLIPRHGVRDEDHLSPSLTYSEAKVSYIFYFKR